MPRVFTFDEIEEIRYAVCAGRAEASRRRHGSLVLRFAGESIRQDADAGIPRLEGRDSEELRGVELVDRDDPDARQA